MTFARLSLPNISKLGLVCKWEQKLEPMLSELQLREFVYE